MADLLIIDDDEDFADAVASVLRDEGHQVSVHLSAEDALERVEEDRPDLVILDVMFPEDSSAGFGLAREMRGCSEAVRNTPVLMLTAINSRFPLGFSKRDIDEEWLPVTDFLEKPVDFNELNLRVDRLLERGAASAASPEKGS